MYQLKVGELYNPERRSWTEGVQFNLRSGQPELLLFFTRPNFHEILAVQKGVCEFGVLAIEDVILFLYRFGSEIAWSDAPFSIHLVPEDDRVIPQFSDGFETRLTLQIVLIEANTGKVRAIRLVSLSPEFSQEIVKLTKKQIEMDFDVDSYDRQIAKIYQRFPDVENLVQECFIFTQGGS